VVEYAHPDFNVTMTLNLVKGKYASIDYTLAAVGKAAERGENHLLPDQKAGAGTLRGWRN
jgi:hypothetical protein